LAGQKPVPTTATPELSCATSFTPGTARAASSRTARTFAPKTGGCSTSATSMPGRCTSMLKTALPVTLSGVSSRFVGWPTMRKSFGSLSGTSCGTGSIAAAAATWPYGMRRPLLPCSTSPFSVRHSDGSTLQLFAAASSSIARAAAPALRSGSDMPATLVLPPVIWMPKPGCA
jgi:hypothetical protein